MVLIFKKKTSPLNIAQPRACKAFHQSNPKTTS